MPLSFPFVQLPAPGDRIQVAPGVFWLRMPLPFQLDHINLWLLEDGDGWCVVDTGFANDATRAAWKKILGGLDRPVSRVIVTHFHPDHLGLAEWFQKRTDAIIYMSAGEFLTAHVVWNEVGGHGARFMVEQFRRHGLDKERLARYETRGSGYRQSMSALPEQYRRLIEGSELRIGGRSWRTIIGYGHSPEHVALHCPELELFISGDMLLPKISTNISVMAATPDADTLAAYLASLDRYARELPATTLVLPSHGLPFVGVQARVDALYAHHAERLRALEGACATPQSAAGVLGTLFQRDLDTHQTMFAMGEAIAHLNFLEAKGRLTRVSGADGVVRFVRQDSAP